MPRTVESTVYKFGELSDRAKERARDWYRRMITNDDYDSVIDDAATMADILGINLRQRPIKLMNGSTRYDPCIWWSGFSSQGDGACFEGSYSYAKGAAKKIRAHAPQDSELHRIASELQAIQRRNGYQLTAQCRQRGHYNHSGCMTVDVERASGERDMTSEAGETVTQLLRDFADWIYAQLGKENDYLNSDEQVDESIDANEYEFDEEGNRARA